MYDNDDTDPYTDPATGVLRNKLDIADAEELAVVEDHVVTIRLAELYLHPLAGRFDLVHLCAIHGRLFDELYDWAGKIRTVTISKGGTTFCFPAFIERYAGQIFGALAKESCLIGVGQDDFTRRMAYYLAEINAIHPFREGNGRSQREFLRQLGVKAGYEIRWQEVSAAEMTTASIKGMNGDLSGFEDIFRSIARTLRS